MEMVNILVVGSWFTPDNRLLKAGQHQVPSSWACPKAVKVLGVVAADEAEEDEAPAAPATRRSR